MPDKQIIVGISGASGAIYGIRLLELLRNLEVHTHLIISNAAKLTIAQETNYSLKEVQALASTVHAYGDIAACISSGSYTTMGMVIAPCSMRSLSEIATGCTTNLLTRSADVTLKERRRLVLLARETPLHLGHLRSMVAVTEMGGIIAPPVPAFYQNPQTLDDIINHTIGRILDLFSLPSPNLKRWNGFKDS